MISACKLGPEPLFLGPQLRIPGPSLGDTCGIQGEKKRSPSDFLKSVLGRPVKVKLNSGIEYRGVLACLDGYMNIAMEQTEEYEDGTLKAKYGDCFIRGNNGALNL